MWKAENSWDKKHSAEQERDKVRKELKLIHSTMKVEERNGEHQGNVRETNERGASNYG